MKGLFLALGLMSLAQAARAQEQVFVTISTPMASGVTVTTGTPVRVDNWNAGFQQLMNGRTEVLLSPPSGAQTIWWGYDSSVDTFTASATYGTELVGGAKANPTISSAIQIWAQAADAAGAAGQRINVQQAAPRVYRVIP